MEGWRFRGDDIEGLVKSCQVLRGHDRVICLWFRKDDLNRDRPIFYFDGDEGIDPRGIRLIISECEEVLLYRLTSWCEGGPQRSLQIDEYGLHVESLTYLDRDNILLEKFRYRNTIEEDGWRLSKSGRMASETKTFQDLIDLPEFWRGVFFHTHRRKFGKRPIKRILSHSLNDFD